MTTSFLFVCTGNSARSQMAEALMRQHRPTFECRSAGLEAQGINPYTLEVLSELAIDTSPLVSEAIFDYIGRGYKPTYLVTVCSRAETNCPVIWPGKPVRVHWPFDDPAAAKGSPDKIRTEFRRIRAQIDEKIGVFLRDEGL